MARPRWPDGPAAPDLPATREPKAAEPGRQAWGSSSFTTVRNRLARCWLARRAFAQYRQMPSVAVPIVFGPTAHFVDQLDYAGESPPESSRARRCAASTRWRLPWSPSSALASRRVGRTACIAGPRARRRSDSRADRGTSVRRAHRGRSAFAAGLRGNNFRELCSSNPGSPFLKLGGETGLERRRWLYVFWQLH